MPSERVKQILRSKTRLKTSEIEALTEAEAWGLIYTQGKRPVDNRTPICFTGFGTDRREQLWNIAELAGFRVVKSVTTRLGILCVGEFPGPGKLAKAKKQGALVIDEASFLRLAATGELPTD